LEFKLQLKIKSSPDGKPRVSAFDGDESNLYAPQSEEARKEVAGIMSAICNIMNAQTNDNVAGVVFDALTGCYILSLPETVVDEDVFMRLRMSMEDDSVFSNLNKRLNKYNVPINSGKALLSSLFPEDFYYKKGDTEIIEGILVSGILNKSNIGSSPGSGSIVQAIYKDYGVNRTARFLTEIYWAGSFYLDTHGFSVGMDDCFLRGKDPEKTIEYEVQKAKMLVKSMGAKVLDPLEEERRETQIRGYLDTAKNFGAKISKENLAEDNSFNIMAKSGAKGSVVNIAQITGILGQQFVSGERMPESISGGTRSLPYFPQGEIDPIARGFVVNSYLTGLTPAETFFALAGSRIGLTDTAVSTQVTGFIHHKIVKCLEDIKVVEDGSVRNTANAIYQFAYGEDGFDASLLEKVETKSGSFGSFINLNRVVGRINTKYGFKPK
jgi:DNA-directed RNA polymerase beta' subunit